MNYHLVERAQCTKAAVLYCSSQSSIPAPTLFYMSSPLSLSPFLSLFSFDLRYETFPAINQPHSRPLY